jgi:integrase
MFDARAAKALKAVDHLTVPSALGLRLETTQQHCTWTYRYRSPVDGRMLQVRLGRWPALGLPGALAAWERMKQQRDAGGDPAAEKRAKRSAAVLASSAGAYTVTRLVQDYLQDYKGSVALKTYAEAGRLLTRELASLDAKPAAQVTRADAFDLLNRMQYRPVVAGILRQQLGAAWDRALDAGRLAPDVPNWLRLVLRGKLKSKGEMVDGKHQGVVKRALDEAELQQLVPWLPNFTRDVEDALTLTLWTACRGAEIVAMHVDELGDESDGLWWTIPKAKLKMRRNPLLTDLRVPLVGRAELVARRRLAAATGLPGGWVLPRAC